MLGMAKGSGQACQNVKTHLLPNHNGDLIGGDNRIILHGAKTLANGFFLGVLIKLLCNTLPACRGINSHVRAIQDVSHETVKAIGEIDKVIRNMNEIASGVAAAVEEQSAATSEITRNIEQAASGTQEVSSNIIDVNRAANDTGSASREVLSASGQLNEQSVSLRSIVENFLKGVKSA
jgi:methyl-accepting chemotaxis protein